jgi:hypothetical protein
MECAASFTALLSELRCVFTAPSFSIFVCLMTGWVLSHRRRFVTELIWRKRLHPARASQPLPSLLQQVGVAAGYALRSAGAIGGAGVCAHGADRVGRGRYALPQAGADRLRDRDAPRSVDLQPGQTPDQLGTRLGGGDADRPLPSANTCLSPFSRIACEGGGNPYCSSIEPA